MNVFFSIFAVLCVLLLAQALAQPRRFYEYPYFMAATFAAFILPQAFGITQSQAVPEEWERDLLLMCFFCLACCWLGYRIRPREGLVARLTIAVNPNRFALCGILLIAVGFVFDYLIGNLPESAKGSQWTGVVTIYLFFANQVFTGFAICLYCALEYQKRLFWV